MKLQANIIRIATILLFAAISIALATDADAQKVRGAGKGGAKASTIRSQRLTRKIRQASPTSPANRTRPVIPPKPIHPKPTPRPPREALNRPKVPELIGRGANQNRSNGHFDIDTIVSLVSKWRHDTELRGLEILKSTPQLSIPTFDYIAREQDRRYSTDPKTKAMADSLLQLGESALFEPNVLLYYEQAATLGSPDAQSRLGYIYLQRGDSIDGARYIKRAADRNFVEAYPAMGRFYEFGQCGYPIDKEKALEWYDKGAAAGSYNCQGCAYDLLAHQGDTIRALKYSKMLCRHKDDQSLTDGQKGYIGQHLLFMAINKELARYGEARDIEGALSLYSDAASLDNAFAIYLLGRLKTNDDCYRYDAGDFRKNFAGYVQHDDDEAWRLIHKAAELGFPEAQAEWADTLYRAGNYNEAAIWFEKAYNNNITDGTAQRLCEIAAFNDDLDNVLLWGQKPECLNDPADTEFYVGGAYAVKEEFDKATEWLEKSVEHGFPESYYILGQIADIKNDSRTAFDYYTKGVELGGWGCASQLAGYYISDEIVPMDLEKVKELCNKAIEEDDTDSGAYFYLGCIYCSLYCTDKADWKTAAEYFSKGATAGDPYSQYCYSKCLEKGKGVKKDKEQAAYWHNIVAQSEDYDYINGIDWQHDNGIKW